VIITARDPDYLISAGLELDGSIAAFDATDIDRLGNRLRPHHVPRSPTTSAIATAITAINAWPPPNNDS
jgi:hypothetical protein